MREFKYGPPRANFLFLDLLIFRFKFYIADIYWPEKFLKDASLQEGQEGGSKTMQRCI